MKYQVRPGLYAAGNPDGESPVLVSANYKMSFDRLRSQLGGIDAWILVLDTRGINVWCAAGKGTFCSEEIVHRVEEAKLTEVVSHRELIVPQLGAPGVAAHDVKRRSGFRVIYGPVRAADLPAFLNAGMEATPDMRRVRFTLGDRLAVVPVELMMSAKYALLTAVCLFIIAGLGLDGYSWARSAGIGTQSALLFLAACFGSTILTPALLPHLPGRAFAFKGASLGLAFLLLIVLFGWHRFGLFQGWLNTAAWALLIPATASFMAMNFTGASTYTSLSGVRREMAVAVPIQIVCVVVGAGFWIAARFT